MQKNKNIEAGFVITCVGALKPTVLRMAQATPERQDIRQYRDSHEIVSLVGTLSGTDCHLHISLSDKEGKVSGGHLKEDSLVDVTAEIVIGSDEKAIYAREMDKDTGFNELVIRKR